MTGEYPAENADTLPKSPDTSPDRPPEKMGLAFYASLVLVGCLVLLVVILNYPAARANAGVMLTQNNWTLQSSTDADGIHKPVISGSEVTAWFGRDGRIAGSAGCNRYTATFTTKDYSIAISEVSQTKMSCESTGFMEQESSFLGDLSDTESFRVNESSLIFYDASGKKVLVFVPV